MWKEILWVKPKVDAGDAKRMERTLGQRFGAVTRRFGAGLKGIIKGSILGISLGVISKLLNPLEAVEQRIKDLIGEATDVRDLADRLNTDPGKIKRLQDVGASLGLSPEKLQDLMVKYAEAVQEGIDAKKKGEMGSEASQAVSAFADEKDLAEGFFQFIQSLAKSPNQAATEKVVFGEQQFGAAKKFIGADFKKEFAGLPSVDTLNTAVNNSANAGDVQNRLKASRESRSFVLDSAQPMSAIVRRLEETEKARAARLSENLKDFESLKRAADGIEGIKTAVEQINNKILDGFGQIKGLKDDIKQQIPKVINELGRAGDRGPKN